MDPSYSISKTLLEKYSIEELKLLSSQRSVDLGWWTRFYGASLGRGVTEEELQRFFQEDIEKLEQEWETDLPGLKKADLLYEYADGFYNGTRDLLDCFLKKVASADNEALPILFLFSQFAELALKASAEYMIHFRSELGRRSERPNLNTHDLELLLSRLKGLFELDEPFLSEETQEFIIKMHRINSASQAFRYPFGREGGRTEKVFMVKAPLVPMGIFRAEFDIHASELIGLVTWLSRGYIYFPEGE